MQFQADLLGVRSCARKHRDDALGAAYFAGLAVGFWQSLEEIARNWRVERRFEPDMSAMKRRQDSNAGRLRSSAHVAGRSLGSARSRMLYGELKRRCELHYVVSPPAAAHIVNVTRAHAFL